MKNTSTQIKSAAPAKDAALIPNQSRHNDSKTDRILGTLRAGMSLNRFEAERLGDHTLNSTISRLRAKGNIITSKWEAVPNRFGSVTRVKRYTYAGEL